MKKKLVALFCCSSIVLTIFLVKTKIENLFRYSDDDRRRDICLWKKVRNKVFSSQNKWLTTFGGLSMPSRQFQSLGVNFYIYSAYTDLRNPSEPSIRILALSERPNDTIICSVLLDDTSETVAFVSVANIYKHPETHHSFYSVHIITCLLPLSYDKRCYNKISTVNLMRKSHRISIEVDEGITDRNLSRCLPVLYGSKYDSEWIKNFFDVNIDQGFQLFQVYVLPTVSEDTLSVLKLYSDRGYVKLISWNLPVNYFQIWYYGQILAVLDCQYSFINNDHALTLFADMDEILLPNLTETNGIHQMLGEIRENKLSVGCRLPTYNTFLNGTNIMSVLRIKKINSDMVDYATGKCLIKPNKVFAMGVHKVASYYKNELSYFTNSTNLFIAHIRQCSSLSTCNTFNSNNDLKE